MAAKKAALLEKRLRREKEAQERRQQQELDQEQKREAARCVSLHQAQHRHRVVCRLNMMLSPCCLVLLQVESRGGAAEEGGRKSEEGIYQE